MNIKEYLKIGILVVVGVVVKTAELLSEGTTAIAAVIIKKVLAV